MSAEFTPDEATRWFTANIHHIYVTPRTGYVCLCGARPGTARAAIEHIIEIHRATTATDGRQAMSAEGMESVLVEHLRKDISSCICGWAKLGHSHPAHVTAALHAAGYGSMHDAWADGWNMRADTAPASERANDHNPHKETT